MSKRCPWVGCRFYTAIAALTAVLTWGAVPSFAGQGDCAQPLTGGLGPRASDCLFILQVAVGQKACLPECICAPRGTLPAKASDALVCLRAAVGIDQELDCPCPVTTTSTTSTTSTTTTTLDVNPPDEWTPAFDAFEQGWMMSGWGSGDGSQWVVGGELAAGKIFRKDATGWQEIDHGIDVELLNWVDGSGPSDVFAAGNDGKILHYDGISWSEQATPVSAPVWGLWVEAANDAWAVGGNVSSGTPFVLRYDGVQWTQQDIPIFDRPFVFSLFKVWGSGPNDIYAVGQNGAGLHWNGTDFSELGFGISQDLVGIWGTGTDDIMIVGGRGTAEMAHFDGDVWTKAAPSALPGLNGVWMRHPGVAYGVGVNGTMVRIDPADFSVVVEVVPTGLDLHGIFGDSQGQLLALGANFDFPERGTAIERRLSDEE
ncbi:MAG: hypothetical protein ACI8TX_001684 [Hyphomicrobiaceae bacterium]|jgi:hypothetical protein